MAQEFEQITSPPQAQAEVIVNESLEAVQHIAVYGYKAATSSALTWGYYGGRWNGHTITAGTLTLTDSATNYIVVARATGVLSTSTSSTNHSNTTDYALVYTVVTAGGVPTTITDERLDTDGVLAAAGGGGGGSTVVAIPVACSDETTALTTGAAKVTFRMPYAVTLTGVRASLTTAQTSGSIFTVDINEAGTTILSTKLTIDNTERTSTTAATPAVISDSSLADDAEITIDIDQIGDGTAKGLKVYLIGTI
jgi:hypothetical protein